MAPSSISQPAILEDLPPLGRFLTFDLRPGIDPRPALLRWRDSIAPARTVLGLGQPLAAAMEANVPGLRAFPGIAGRGLTFPSTQGALWTFLAGSDPTELFDRVTTIRSVLGDGFALREEVATFKYRGGRDLTGFVDGTENPKGDKAVAAAVVSGRGDGLDGSSFVGVQKYIHDLAAFGKQPTEVRDQTIGRHEETDEEMPDAPVSAHVKRTAQESFDPPAFILRRSLPFGDSTERGLYFCAYVESLDRYERLLKRMAGLEDGVVDALLSYTRAVTGAFYWCPPMRGGKVDLRALGL